MRHAKFTGGKAAVDVERNRIKRDNFIQRENIPYQKPIVQPTSENQLSFLERELTEYIVLHGDKKIYVLEDGMEEALEIGVAELIFSELELDSIVFTDSNLSSIIETYRELLAKSNGEEIDLSSLINNPSPDICKIIADIIFNKDAYIPSKIWSKVDESVIDVEASLSRAVPKAIAIYKQKVVDKMIDDLKKSIATATSNEQSLDILKNIHMLEQAKKSICQKYQRIR